MYRAGSSARGRAWAIFSLACFVATAFLGVWAAYDRPLAWIRCGMIVLGAMVAVGMAGAGWQGGEKAAGRMMLACGILGGLLGVYFLLTHDWHSPAEVKVAVLQQAGLWLQAHRPEIPAPERINSNVAGGALALLLPLGVGGLVWAWHRCSLPARGVLILALALAGTAFVLAASRGAWGGLACGCLLCLLLAWSPRHWLGALALPVILLSPALVLWAALNLPGMERWLGGVGVTASALGRVELWRHMIGLVRDYPFTGSGLASTMMTYSTYFLLIHVGYIGHAHNLFLQVAIEQGVAGLLAFLGLLTCAARSIWQARPSPLRLGTLAALVALAVHGCVEAGVYAGKAAPVILFTIGCALALPLSNDVATPNVITRPLRRLLSIFLPSLCTDRERSLTSIIIWKVVPAALGLTIMVALVGQQSALRSMWQANLGAVAQSRAELAVYSWPAWPLQDVVRRSPSIDLGPAQAHYQSALALDPADATANRRLGQIELSLGQYEAAREHLEAAYQAEPGERATRQLLGESYAIDGQIDQAAALWQTIDVSEGQLDARQFWYEYIGDMLRAERIRQSRELMQ